MSDAPRVLRLGDDVNTDDIIPALRCTRADPEHLARYAFEHEIGEGVLARDYDEIEAGRNFGCGSSREHAPLALAGAGIRRVRAHSFAAIFHRNSVNIGLPLERSATETGDSTVRAIVEAGGLFAYNRARREAGGGPRGPVPAVARPMTLAEKVLARASGRASVAPGELVFARVDMAMSQDAVAGPAARRLRDEFGESARIWDPSRLVLVADHFIQVEDVRRDPQAPALLGAMRRFAEEQGCRLFDVVAPGDAAGICHVLLPEHGLVRPGTFVVGTDSHTCTLGAFGCLAVGIGTTDLANLLAMGDVWIRVPSTLRFELRGRLPRECSAKDVMLFLIGRIGCNGAEGRVVEFSGELVDALPIEERMTLCNMAAECGAVCGVVQPDERLRDHLRACGAAPSEELASDPGAAYERRVELDLGALRPQVARPPSPDNVVDVDSLGRVPITRAFVGSCTGGKLHDLAQAAEVLEGRRIADGVQMFVVPASQAVRIEAGRRGYLATFEAAGVTILRSGCGACINAGKGALGPGEAGVYATSRNFKGRSGDPSARNYLASPRVVAISALRGHITDRVE